MKGKVLGFNAGDGAGIVTGEDGKRYRFVVAEWCGERPPAAGAAVDFAAEGDRAIEIYPIGTSLGLPTEALAGPGMDKAIGLFRTSLATPLACVVLLACFMPAISGPAFSMSMFGLGSIPDIGSAAMLAGERAPGSLATVQGRLFLRFAAPIAALWLIWAAWADKSLKLPMLVCGAAAILAGVMAFALRSAIISMMGMLGGMAGSVISVGFGAWLIALAGIALILAAVNVIRNPLAGA